MASLSRISGALVAPHVENTAALFNVNCDFTLVSFEAPPQYQGLGNSLSWLRRKNAESGPIHRTVRKLGAYFDGLVPPCPELLNAYGIRASEIAKEQETAKAHARSHGPFADFAGTDATSLWAAATSHDHDKVRHPHLAVYLLGCMLARAWAPNESVSIWDELVAERLNELRSAPFESLPVSSCIARNYEITRKELKEWDASVRAWLRSADETRNLQQIQLILILKNLDINVGNGSTTYESVISAWKHAIIGMDKLVQGVPQQVSDPSILIALSAWHLYPDLLVLGNSTTTISFNDSLIRSGGIVTIGMQFEYDRSGEGMQWALTLSHLRHYGTVRVKSEIDGSRVSMEQLLIVVFGALLESWRVPKNEEIVSAEWIVALYRLCSSASSDETQADNRLHFDTWLNVLARAGKLFLTSAVENPQTCCQLVGYGRRRGQEFLGLYKMKPTPYFGLVRASILPALNAPNCFEAAIWQLRFHAKARGLTNRNAIIRYSQLREGDYCIEYATAIPHRRLTSKHLSDGSLKQEDVHCRWILPPPRLLNYPSLDPLYPAYIFSERCAQIEALGESCKILDPMNQPFWLFNAVDNAPDTFSHAACRGQDQTSSQNHHCKVNGQRHTLPAILSSPADRLRLGKEEIRPCLSSQTPCACFELGRANRQVEFDINYGEGAFGLFVRREDFTTTIRGRESKQTREENVGKLPKGAISFFQDRKVNRNTIIQYLNGYSFLHCASRSRDSQRVEDGMNFLLKTYRLCPFFYNSLIALHMAAETYEPFGHATIPLKILDLPLYEAKWISEHTFDNEWTRLATRKGDAAWPTNNGDLLTDHYLVRHAHNFTRAERLASIVMFESGIHNVEAEITRDVIAVASDNSLFVASELLTDPLRSVDHPDIVRRVLGSIGKSGISLLLIPTGKPRVRALSVNYLKVRHLDYDLRRRNSFPGTSLHLSFTGWKQPMLNHGRGAYDNSIRLIEVAVSVHDHGEWVADLDVLTMSNHDFTWKETCDCQGNGEGGTITSIDQWEELLDPPTNLGIVRAQSNWAARLATLTLCSQQSFFPTYICSPEQKLCEKCLPALFFKKTGSKRGIIID